jgi:hypothetical protein
MYNCFDILLTISGKSSPVLFNIYPPPPQKFDYQSLTITLLCGSSLFTSAYFVDVPQRYRNDLEKFLYVSEVLQYVQESFLLDVPASLREIWEFSTISESFININFKHTSRSTKD